MDCNKEDAVKAQQLAESKLVSEDYVGAKKFIVKAQRLYPDLSGLPQMLAVVDVHISAIEDISNADVSASWHQILQVDRSADEETVRKQYRRLLLLLHPDKNKYTGAASAFKFVKDAWEDFESEKDSAKVFANEDGIGTHASKASHFRTMCPECKATSEHAESLEHQYVQCLHCLRPFIAVRFACEKEAYQKKYEDENGDVLRETKKDPEVDGVKVEERSSDSDEWLSELKCSKNHKAGSTSEEKKKGNGKRKSPKSQTSKCTRRPSATLVGGSSRGKCTSKRKRHDAVLLSETDTDLSEDNNFASDKPKENGYMHDAEVSKGEGTHHQKQWDLVEDDTDKFQDLKNQLFERLKCVIVKEFHGGEYEAVEVKQDHALGGEGELIGTSKALHLKVAVRFMPSAPNVHASASENCRSEIWEEDQESVDCQVPDNDVYDFDKERQEENFEPGQIWAVYDDDDGLPRFYAHIAEVISVHPFNVRMNWLYPGKSVSEEVQAWVQAGFAYTSGDFKFGKALTRKSVGMFSHMMAYQVGCLPRHVHIYPQKGDVWALYKVWKPRKGATRACEPAEVISSYSEEFGVEVAPLFKVNGYRSIFYRKENEGVRHIPRSELTRFSHQVPAHHFVGGEELGLPRNCLDLDMAAITI